MPAAKSVPAAPVKVDIGYLTGHLKQFLGKTVEVHACWVSAEPHGSFIEPCGKNEADSRHILLIDPDEHPHTDLYRLLATHQARTIEADFSGTVKQIQHKLGLAWIHSYRTRSPYYVLMLEHVSNPKVIRF